MEFEELCEVIRNIALMFILVHTFLEISVSAISEQLKHDFH